MIDIGSPEFLWGGAIWHWRDSGDLSRCADLILQGVPIPEGDRQLVADILLGKASRGVGPNHKPHQYRTALWFRRDQSRLFKAMIIYERAKGLRKRRRGVSLDDEVAEMLRDYAGRAFAQMGISVTAKTVRHDTQGRARQIKETAFDVVAEVYEQNAQDSGSE